MFKQEKKVKTREVCFLMTVQDSSSFSYSLNNSNGNISADSVKLEVFPEIMKVLYAKSEQGNFFYKMFFSAETEESIDLDLQMHVSNSTKDPIIFKKNKLSKKEANEMIVHFTHTVLASLQPTFKYFLNAIK